MKNDLGDIEIFGENLYAIHSIEYRKLETHFYVLTDEHWTRNWKRARLIWKIGKEE
mgnify:FL=1